MLLLLHLQLLMMLMVKLLPLLNLLLQMSYRRINLKERVVSEFRECCRLNISYLFLHRLLLLLLLLVERTVRPCDRVRPPQALWRARRVSGLLQLPHALSHADTAGPRRCHVITSSV